MRMTLNERVREELKYWGVELGRIGAITTIFTAPIIGLGYLTKDTKVESSFRNNQQNAARISEENCAGRNCSTSERLTEFLKCGGRVYIR